MFGLIKHNMYTGGLVFLVWFALCAAILFITGIVSNLANFSIAAFGFLVTTPMLSTGMVKKEILSRWSVQESVLPIRKYQVVTTKYIVHCIYLIPCLIGIFAIFFVLPLSKSAGATVEISVFVFLGVCLSLLYGALYIPFLYILKEANPDIVSPLCSLIAAGLFVLSMNIFDGASLFEGFSMRAVYIALFIGLVYVVSNILSWYVYKKREF